MTDAPEVKPEAVPTDDVAGTVAEAASTAADTEMKTEDVKCEPEAVSIDTVAGTIAEAASTAAETEQNADEAATAKRARAEPVKLGYKTLASGNEACAYFKSIMNMAPKNVNLNEYEFKALADLLRRGHPEAEKKMGTGLTAFQVREYNEGGAPAFYAIRKDGSAEDFSYLKCLGKLFSDVGADQGRGKRQEGGEKGGRGDSKGAGGRGRGRGGPRGRGRGGRR